MALKKPTIAVSGIKAIKKISKNTQSDSKKSAKRVSNGQNKVSKPDISKVTDSIFMGLQKHTIKELIRASPNIFFLIDKKGQFRFANRLASKLFRHLHNGSRRLSDNLPEVRLSKVKDCINQSDRFDFMLVRNNKTYHFFVRCLKKSQYAAFFGVETTELTRIEADLVKSQSILRKVLDTDPNLIFVKDIKGKFILVNQAVADAYGTTVDSLIGKSDADFNPNTEEIAAYIRDDREVILQGKEKIIQQESVTDSKGNTRYFSTVKRPLRIGVDSETCVLGVSTDITSLRNLQEVLHQATKMEALGQLAGGVAHDFNNLLTAIQGHAELIKISNQNNPSISKSVEMIETAAERAKLLTDQLLGFARKGKHQDCSFDLHLLIHDTLALLKRTLEPKISISTNLLAGESFIRGDPGQLQQVIMNLCINARDALLEKKAVGAAKLEITTSSSFLGKDFIPAIEMQVSDNGSGMPQSVASRVFEPFFTTKEVGRGTGLGLSTVYGVVCNHGGEVTLKTEVNVGSSFFVTLPICEKHLETKKIKLSKQKKSLQLPAGSKILLVDDHSDVLLVVGEMLQSLGLEVIACGTGTLAIAELAKAPAEISLAIVDMVMPDIGGAETIREIRKIKAELPVIFISGFTNDKASQRLTSQGIPFLSKPFSMEALKNSISLALASVEAQAAC